MIIIGVAGASGSGKSLLANTLVSELGSSRVTVLPEDCYYKNYPNLTFEQRCNLNFDHPESFEHELLIKHLKALKSKEDVRAPVYDYKTHSRSQNVRLISSDHAILLLEGILLFHDPEVRELMDIKIFVDTDLDLAFIRRLRRDVSERGRSMESVLSQYETTVRPMFYKFIEPSKFYADINVPHGGKNKVAIDMISAKMKDFLCKAN